MSLIERLRDRPVVAEVIPPRIGASQSQIEGALQVVQTLVDTCRVDAVNVPEIIGSGFQSMDPLDFGLLVQDRFGVEVIVNKVVVHEPEVQFRAWIERALREEAAGVILVGGERGGIYYPGPRVIQANRIAKEIAETEGRALPVGNVTLPTRANEAARMLEKTENGCDFFTSQIVYEFPSINTHLQAYEDVCALARQRPSPILYAFSPVDGKQDILFLRYLGVNVPPDVEASILAGKGTQASLDIITDVWNRLTAAAQERGVRVPIGLVLETVSRHNADAVATLVRRLRPDLAKNGAEPVSAASRL